MLKDSLPLHVNVTRFADNATHLHGYLQLKDMPMLCRSLASSEGDVEVELQFDKDSEGIKHVQGHIEAQVNLQCQRCLESFKYEIIGDFLSALISGEEAAKSLPDQYDPFVVSDNELQIKDLIEEELILSIPIVPMHDAKECHKTTPLIVADNANATFEKESPFKVIESLKRKKD